jgi:antitoxin (DNA-binding transcriptional repressor) of toxin-antitoxin stability system
MRSISIQEFEQDPKACIAEAEAGQRLVLVRGGKAVVEITPVAESAQTISAERSAALDRLSAIMDKGYDMGLVWNGRDELYDRDV